MVSLFQTTRYSFLMTARWLIQESLNFFCSRCIFLTKVKDHTMNQPLDVLRSRFYIASQSLSYLRHLKHITHQRKILQGLTKTNAKHINSNFSALTAQTFTTKLADLYFNGFCFCIFSPYRYPLPNVRLLS